MFQCSSASRKFLNGSAFFQVRHRPGVSVLFSEPKIPQFSPGAPPSGPFACFSALQRAENSSMKGQQDKSEATYGFSALQRAENSSIQQRLFDCFFAIRFQCSSASRKFLNLGRGGSRPRERLFQCSSASRKFLNSPAAARTGRCVPVSVLFSEPKIPQSAADRRGSDQSGVSVLFSEPKIPQFISVNVMVGLLNRFSALQRAENSSMPTLAPASIHISDRDDHASSFLSLPGASP